MTQSPPSRPLNRFRRALPLVALAVSAGLAAVPAWAQTAAPRAGTSIGNQATATYNDGSNIPRNVQSNSVTTVVQQVAAVDLTDPRSINAAPGAPIAFPHTIQNNGNGIDTFNITLTNPTGDFGINPQIFADANQDGVPDNTTPITQTPSLAPGEKFNFVVVGTVPAGQAANTTSSINVNAISVNTPGISDTNTDTVRVSNNAVINVTKAVGGPAAGGVYTYTLRYTNNSNVASGALTLTDTLNSRLTYVPGSGRYSQNDTTALTDANDTGVDPAGVSYSRSGQVVTATIASVPARTTGAVSFSVTVAGSAPGIIPNRAAFSYDDNNDGTQTVPGETNNVDVNVAQAPAVTITDDTVDEVNQGATVTFTNVVTNGGNGTDTFDITVANPGTFPPGTTFQLFQTGGAATLLDSNGNGIPDTGPIASGGTYSVVVKATLPATSTATGPFAVGVTATSGAPGKPSATGTDTVNAVNLASVDITNRAGGVRTETVQTIAGNPGTVVTFPLSAQNTSNVNDNYALSFVPNPALPAGFNVVFRDANGQIITNTGNLAPAAFFDYVAEVTVPANATPQDIALAFTVTSGASGATDTIGDVLRVNSVVALTLTPNNQGQVFPGSSINYAHVVTNNGNATLTNLDVTTTDSLAGFSSVTYADLNGNGILDPNEQAAGPLATIPTLAAGGNFPVIVQVFGPSNQFSSGAVNTTTLTATVRGSAPVVAASATDTTTIVAGDVTLSKSQSVLQADGTTIVTANTQGNASALPGQIIRYTILVRNTGGAAVNTIVVSDTTPAFTTYTTTGGAATYTSSDGTSGTGTVSGRTLTWTIPTLAPGATATVTFNVKIDG